LDGAWFVANLYDAICNGFCTYSDYSCGCNFTLFAPTDSAFATLDQELRDKLFEPAWVAHLTNLLEFHATQPTSDRVLSYDLADGDVLSMLNGEKITLSVDTTGLPLSSEFTESARVTEADFVAKNGVLHKIDNVLLPRFVFTDLIGLGNTAAGAEYSVLFSLFELLDIGSLFRAAGDVTVLAPTDAACIGK
jgi:uncharacterized surface protein with fasciclin (FAS1) repeats